MQGNTPTQICTFCVKQSWACFASGRWHINPATRQLELLNPVPQQLLRLALSATSTIFLLLLGAAVLLCCLNLQGYIPPTHGLLFISRLAAFSQPGGSFSKASGVVLSQVGSAGCFVVAVFENILILLKKPPTTILVYNLMKVAINSVGPRGHIAHQASLT